MKDIIIYVSTPVREKPEKARRYFTIQGGKLRTALYYSTTEQFTNNPEYWLREVPLPTEEEIEQMAKEHYSEQQSGGLFLRAGFIAGMKALRDRLTSSLTNQSNQ